MRDALLTLAKFYIATDRPIPADLYARFLEAGIDVSAL